MRRRRWIIVAAVTVPVAVVVGVGVGLVHGYGPLPVIVSAPPERHGSGCAGRIDDWDRSRWPALFWVGVGAGARSVTARWWPNIDDPDCHVVVTHGGAAVAAVLIRDIQQAPAIGFDLSSGCPADFGGAVDLFFDYGGGRWERVRVYPSGCGEITAPDRQPRSALFGNFDNDLAAIAPPGWQPLLH